jgi:hypothetical protein
VFIRSVHDGLQDTGATFVSRPTADTGIDFVVAYPNGQGGMNPSAVEVKATEQPVGEFYPLDTSGTGGLRIAAFHRYCLWQMLATE